MTAITPKNIVAGQSATVSPQYKYEPFPKAVYKDSLDNCVIIKSEDERPDGYVDYDDIVGGTTQAEDDAKAAAAEAKKAEKEYRAGIMAYLDEHDVDYAKNLSTPKLEELKVALDEHLGQQDLKDDAE